jgi:hypothetical protein
MTVIYTDHYRRFSADGTNTVLIFKHLVPLLRGDPVAPDEPGSIDLVESFPVALHTLA